MFLGVLLNFLLGEMLKFYNSAKKHIVENFPRMEHDMILWRIFKGHNNKNDNVFFHTKKHYSISYNVDDKKSLNLFLQKEGNIYTKFPNNSSEKSLHINNVSIKNSTLVNTNFTHSKFVNGKSTIDVGVDFNDITSRVVTDLNVFKLHAVEDVLVLQNVVVNLHDYRRLIYKSYVHECQPVRDMKTMNDIIGHEVNKQGHAYDFSVDNKEQFIKKLDLFIKEVENKIIKLNNENNKK